MTKPSIESPIWRSLITGVFFALVTAVLIFVAWEIGESSQISQALALISGMTAMATLSAFNQFRQSGLETESNIEGDRYRDSLQDLAKTSDMSDVKLYGDQFSGHGGVVEITTSGAIDLNNEIGSSYSDLIEQENQE